MMKWFKKSSQKDQSVTQAITNIERKFEVYRIAIALLISLSIIIIIIALVAEEPLESIKTLVLGPLSSLRRMGNVIELTIPLTFTGLAITMMFKTHRFNLSAVVHVALPLIQAQAISGSISFHE